MLRESPGVLENLEFQHRLHLAYLEHLEPLGGQLNQLRLVHLERLDCPEGQLSQQNLEHLEHLVNLEVRLDQLHLEPLGVRLDQWDHFHQ